MSTDNDPVEPAAVYRRLDEETLARALMSGHLFEHLGDLSTCDTEDEPAARRYAADILAALDGDAE